MLRGLFFCLLGFGNRKMGCGVCLDSGNGGD